MRMRCRSLEGVINKLNGALNWRVEGHVYVYIGFDIVVAMYEGQRYEVELKYTTFVDIQSRPTLPRYIYISTHREYWDK